MPYCYILYSPSKNTYYIGFTQTDLTERIFKHNSGFYDKTYSSYCNDWILYLSIECVDASQAMKIEKHIKRMKSKVYIENLKKYPEIVVRLLKSYKST
ncbi:MAG: GIY-YIG nuclease family protein [Flavobacteriales bacterium]|nr:GIY-YIG nuclease family protein [Flavobacteriales bacterium]